MIRAIQQVSVIAVMLVTMFGTSNPCQAQNPIIFGGLSNIPPLSFEEDGFVKGFFSDVFLTAAQRAGIDIQLELYPVQRLVPYLRSGEIDGAVAIAHTKERAEYLIYSLFPIMISRYLVFVKKGSEFPFNAISDLYGKNIGVLKGWAVDNAELLQAINEGRIQVAEVTRPEQNLKKLMSARIDCLVATEQLTWYHANELGIATSLKALEMPIAAISVFFAISKYAKNITDPQAFLKRMNASLDEVLSDGTYEELQKKYKVTSTQ